MAWVTVLIIFVIAVVIVAAVAWLLMQRRSRRLRERFGPEYQRTVARYDNRLQAEAELEEREKWVERLALRPIPEADRLRYLEAWRTTQARFVDDPAGAVAEADTLVEEAMQARGYPMSDFEQRAADISVHHASVVDDYRAAHSIALRSARGEASTEELRRSMVYYRSLFEDLLQSQEAEVG